MKFAEFIRYTASRGFQWLGSVTFRDWYLAWAKWRDNALLQFCDIYLPLTHTAIPTRGSITPSFTRATTETGQKWYEAGYLDFTALAGEIVFKGARREYNQVSTKSADNTVGSTISANVTAATTTLMMTAANGSYWYKNSNGNAAIGRVYQCSADVSSTVDRTLCLRALATSGTNSDVQNVAITSTVQRVKLKFTADIVGVVLFGVENRVAYATDTSTTGVITFTNVQISDITGETDQTTIRPYVSVGATSGNNYGTELVSNGTFDTATTSWTASNLNGSVATLSSVGGRLRITNNAAGGRGAALQTITLVSGKSYTFTCQSWTGTSAVTSAQVRLGTTPAAFDIGLASSTADGQTLSFNFTASGTTAYLTLDEVFGDASEYIEFDDVSIKENLFHGSMVDGVKCFDTDRSGNPISTTGSYPLVGYVPWEARTNSLLHARDLSNAAWVKVNCTGVKNAVGSDGVTNSASTMTATGANATVLQTIVLAAAARSYSVKLKRKTGSGTVSICRDGVTFTDITAQINSSTYTTVKIENTSVLNPVCGIKLATSGDAVYVDWNQDEAGAFITPAINTTTVAVARNADLLTYTGADVALLKTLMATFSRGVGVSSSSVMLASSDGTLNNFTDGSITGTSTVGFAGVSGGSTQWNQLVSNNYTAGTDSKIAWSPATNNILMDKDGVAQTPDTVATVPAVTQLNVGHLAGTLVLNGPVNHIYGWTRNFSKSELGAVDRA